jgi:hypothetical protein
VVRLRDAGVGACVAPGSRASACRKSSTPRPQRGALRWCTGSRPRR